MQEKGVTDLESSILPPGTTSRPGIQSWFKVGAIAAASALAGGLAAAWYYRKTLERLREAGDSDDNPNFDIPEEESEI